MGLRTCPRWFLHVFLPKGVMNIQDSFLEPRDSTDMTEDEMDELHKFVEGLVTEANNDTPLPDDQLSQFVYVAGLSFRAGRVYQADQEPVDNSTYPINMDRDMLGLFIEFLAERAQLATE